MTLPAAPSTTLIPGAGGLHEALHWRGGPAASALALRVWRLPLVAVYFAALLADGLWRLHVDGGDAAGWRGETALLIIAAATLGTLGLLAWLSARASTYEITETHLVMRYGVALKVRLAIPFGAITGVAVRMNGAHSGDIAVHLKSAAGLNYLKLWPHVRPLRILAPEPMLRSVKNAGYVGSLLTARVREAAEIREALTRLPAPAPVLLAGDGSAQDLRLPKPANDRAGALAL